MTTITTFYRHNTISFTALVLVAIWVASMILLPIARWTLGDEVIPTGVTVSAVLQASAVFFIVRTAWGLRRTVQAFALVAVLTWGAEWIGSRTGFPFGTYHYTDVLQPQVGGVPLLIPVAWFMLLPSAWAIAQRITANTDGRVQWLARIAISAGALTAWDLFLDPQMVQWGFWEWETAGGYFGIPWSNYAGWLLVSAVVTAIVRPAQLPAVPLLIIYGVVWILQTIGLAFFWGQPGPALIGFVGMGLFLAAALLKGKA